HLLEGLGLDDAVLVGWSMGSLVVWDMIRQFGADGLAGHVVVSQSPSALRRPGWELSGLTLDALHEILAAGQADYRSLMEEFVRAMLMDDPSAADLELLVAEAQTVGPNAGTCILLDQSLQDYRDLVGTHRLPTLLAWGRDEKMIRVASGEWLAERIPADLVIFERSGHCPMWEEPDRFNRVVSDWISAL
ncbi:MAG: alpha/beta fold hydrolase, partial [Gaiellales bacterium]